MQSSSKFPKANVKDIFYFATMESEIITFGVQSHLLELGGMGSCWNGISAILV